MKSKLTAIALILASGLVAGTPALAEVTREQVRAELAEAVRSGDILANGESSLKLNELYPSRYPAKQMQAGLTREQVRAELAEAVRSGNILAQGESSLKLNELYPNRYPAKRMQAGVREQARAQGG